MRSAIYRVQWMSWGLSCLAGVGASAQTVTIDFESLPVGTLFGAAAGDEPGDVVFSQGGVEMSVENFMLDEYTGFVKAEVGGKFDPFFPTTPLGLENISVRFDVSGMSIPVTFVSIEYLEFGGANNFSVNDHTLFQLENLTQLPSNVAPGVTATVTADHILLNGLVDSFLIGGQELAIDNTTAAPEPATSILLAGGLIACGIGMKARRRSAALNGV